MVDERGAETQSAIERGRALPLGAHARDGGVNFALVSEHATKIELCLFDDDGRERRLALPGRDADVFHGFVAGVGPGQIYGLRAHGPWAPERGHRFDPERLLLDPRAREIVAQPGATLPSPALLCRVPTPLAVAAPGPPRPRIPVDETVLYELHVKGFTKLHPDIPEQLRGTFAGLAHPASLAHLQALGVTTLSLLPVHYCVPERHLAPLGLTNYWGYNTIGFFCPDPRLSSAPADPTATRAEFRAMVEAVHGAGLEVVLDVVYNHSAEGDERGPTLSFRGLDNALYYRLDPADHRRYRNWSGCGNTLDCAQPRVVQLILDSLRHWVADMGVDGFRFDLAPILGRAPVSFDPRAPLLVALAQDPVLAGVKLIAEPWDLGPEGYQLGAFPRPFMEWNDRFRDAVRRTWLRRDLGRGELARRLAGSSDCFGHGLRRPSASVNYVTAHDGFTLADLVSFERKHNLDNGEQGRDGHSHNLSTNCGVEGPTDDPEILATRDRLKRALLTTLFVARGTPMLLAGDELGNSQAGNNNAYCQDNARSWLDWSSPDRGLVEHVSALVRLRRAHPVLRADRWLGDSPGEASVAWRRPDGAPMQLADWNDAGEHRLAVELHGDGDALLLLFNPEGGDQRFALPPGAWRVLIDSAGIHEDHEDRRAALTVAARSLVVLGRAAHAATDPSTR